MNRIVVTNGFVGICHMQVCAMADASDEEILAVCNSENPSGTSIEWVTVIHGKNDNRAPVPCAQYPNRLHILVGC